MGGARVTRNLTMDTAIIDLDGVGPMTFAVFQRAGFLRVGQLFRHEQQELVVRRAAEDLAREAGRLEEGHWRALAARCVTLIKRVRNPQYTEFGGLHPEVFLCPLTYEEFEDPVITPSGMTYERCAIVRALQAKAEDPLTRLPLTADDLIPNRALKEAIDYYNTRLRRFALQPRGR